MGKVIEQVIMQDDDELKHDYSIMFYTGFARVENEDELRVVKLPYREFTTNMKKLRSQGSYKKLIQEIKKEGYIE